MECFLDGTDTQTIKVVNRFGIPETMLRVFVSFFSAFNYEPNTRLGAQHQGAYNHQDKAPAYQLIGKVYAGAVLLC